MKTTRFACVLFDLDGVLVPTTKLHKEAWKQLFDAVLPAGSEPYTEQDYYTYVDGKPRYDGVDALLKSRGVNLEWGSPDDGPDVKTVCGYGNRKNTTFERLLNEEGIQPYPDTVDVLRHLTTGGKRLAVVSSSKNTATVLEAAGIAGFFSTVVDGNTKAELGLKGKPAPDTYAYAAKLLGLRNQDAIVVEDALSGVAAGHAGRFGLVVGVDRGAGHQDLLEAGADTVIDNLIELVEDDGGERRLKENPDLDPDRYPIDEWSFTEVGDPDAVSATNFSVTNGNIGVRGQGDDTRCLGNGTFLSGFHDTFDINHPEGGYGYAKVGQLIQGVPDASDFTLKVDGIPLTHPEETRQSLDFRAGICTTTHLYRLDDGTRLKVDLDRMACLFDRNLAVYTVKVDSPDRDMTVVVDGAINADMPRRSVTDDPRKSQIVDGCGVHEVLDNEVYPEADGDCRVYRCNNSRLSVALGVRQTQNGQPVDGQSWRLDIGRGGSASLVRYAVYQSHPILPQGTIGNGLVVQTRGEGTRNLVEECRDILDRVAGLDLQEMKDRQREWLDRFWEREDIRVGAGDQGRTQQLVHWELFQLAQSTAHITNGVGAKGLSGSGYSGHYFWDTEIYILPFLIYSDPQRAREVLHYRYLMLPAARRRAAALNLGGGLFPWRTINGEESSAYFPTGTAQYHIDADVAYAVAQYVQVCDDQDFLETEGIDILVETARLWMSLGRYKADGRFHIHCVTGPDEYTVLVDDNLYTNAMAKFNLMAAYRAYEYLRRSRVEMIGSIRARLHFTDEDAQEWLRAAEAMFVPYDNNEGVHAQDAQFMERPIWHFDRFTARPLLLYYHPLVIYRHKVLKQTDVVMALYLLSSWFTPEQKRADFDYYDPLTTGDSTLSAASQSIVAAEVGRDDLAMRYFRESLFTDVSNLHANTADGIHLAACGGVWSSLVCGFGGLRDTGGTSLSIDPHLPEDWDSLSYQLTVGDTRFRVSITRQGVDLERLSGPEIVVKVQGHPQTV